MSRPHLLSGIFGLILFAASTASPTHASDDLRSLQGLSAKANRSRFAWLKFWQVEAPRRIEPTIARGQSPVSVIMPEVPADMPASATACERISAESQTGTLIFSEGDCLLVKAVTASRFTHVAAIVMQDGKSWVYDSMNGTGVRRLSLEDYLAIQSPDLVTLYHPHRPFSPEEAARFQSALESQLGRPYSIRHYLTGFPADGVHCSEYLTSSLQQVGWLTCENPANVSPCSLRTGILKDGMYVAGAGISTSCDLEPIPEPGSWYGEFWQALALRTDQSCTQISRRVLCR